MPSPFSKNSPAKDMLLIVAVFFALIFLAFKSYMPQEGAETSLDQIGVNSFYQALPEDYADLLHQIPLDSTLGADEAIRQSKKKLKFDAHIVQNELQRELILIRPQSEDDSLHTKSIKFNVYPVHQEFTKNNFATLQSNVITYYYEGQNYDMVRQVLPNIAVNKIVCYTQQWQTLINHIDNSMIASKDAPHIARLNEYKQDSIYIGVNGRSSAYGFLLRKALENADISFLPTEAHLPKANDRHASDDFTSYLKQQQLQLLHIDDDLAFWQKLTHKKVLPDFEPLTINGDQMATKFNAYLSGTSPFEAVFDIAKLSGYYTLLNLFSERSENELYLNLNAETGLLEPYVVAKSYGKRNTYLKHLNINDKAFLQQYAADLDVAASFEFIEETRQQHADTLRKILEVQQHIAPTDLFEPSLFRHNQLIIKKALDPSTMAKVALVSYDKQQMVVTFENSSNFPLAIMELSYQQKKFITAAKEDAKLVMPGERRKVTFDLPDSFDNLFVHKKKKTTGFIFDKDIFDLAVGYHILGNFEMRYNAITPFRDLDDLAETDDLLRSESDLSTFEFLTVDENDRTISFSADSVVLNEPLVLPAGYMIEIKAGTQIDIVHGGKLISKSPLRCSGTEENPIKIYSSDRRGQGVFVLGAKATSEIRHVTFDHLTNPAHGLWDITGAVVFYDSPVNLDHVLFANNSCEDGLNIIRTHFNMSNTVFRNTQSDAFDGDFVQGTLTNCSFENLGNDAVDVSGSVLEMYDLKITKAGDKALSAGEDSQMIAERIIIDHSEIAVAGKDLSVVRIKDATITNTKLAFTAFQKKPEFGASDIAAEKVRLTQVETPYLIENGSSLLLNGVQAETIDAVKEQMYGVEFGVDSKETRVKKTPK